MADLDDFFAKKDRKRNKGQKKTDEGGKKETTRERPRPRDGEEPRTGEEEEWKEYEETVKDYTGLKIQVLQGTAAGGGANDAGPTGDESVAGQEQGKTKGPWNKGEAPESAAVEEEEKPPARPERVEAPPAPKSNVYKPPSIRRVAAPEPEVRRRQQNRHAPDIHNADYFPELGSSGVKRGGGGWNTATGPQTATRAPTQQRRPLALDNRFTSLQDDS